MSPAARRLTVAALLVCSAAVGVVVLWPQHLAVPLGGRLHGILVALVRDGAPASLAHSGVLDVAVNIALFVPLGLLGALLLPRRRWWVAALACLVLSAGIELAQHAFLPGRSASVRDVACNTAGALLGCAVAAAFRRFRPARPRGRHVSAVRGVGTLHK